MKKEHVLDVGYYVRIYEMEGKLAVSSSTSLEKEHCSNVQRPEKLSLYFEKGRLDYFKVSGYKTSVNHKHDSVFKFKIKIVCFAAQFLYI